MHAYLSILYAHTQTREFGGLTLFGKRLAERCRRLIGAIWIVNIAVRISNLEPYGNSGGESRKDETERSKEEKEREYESRETIHSANKPEQKRKQNAKWVQFESILTCPPSLARPNWRPSVKPGSKSGRIGRSSSFIPLKRRTASTASSCA